MSALDAGRWVLVGFACITLLAGCAAAATASPTTRASSAQSPTPEIVVASGAAMSSSPDAPAALCRATGAVHVTGMEEFLAITTPAAVTTLGDVELSRDMVVEVKDTMSDLRVSGKGTCFCNLDKYPGGAVQFG